MTDPFEHIPRHEEGSTHLFEQARVARGSTPTFRSTPSFLDLTFRDEHILREVIDEVRRGFEYRSHSMSRQPRPGLTFMIEADGAFRPGHLGPRRAAFEEAMNKNFGEEFWSIQHEINGRLVTKEMAYEIFTLAYQRHFEHNPKDLEDLVKNYAELFS